QGSDVIWGFDFLDKNRITFTEKSGLIRIVQMDTGNVVNVANVPPIQVHGQGGLMDIALHPNFKTNHTIYFAFTVKIQDAFETRIASARLIDNKLENVKALFTSNSKSTQGQHFGSRIVFDRKGHIFFSVGERGERDNAQELSIAAGKIFRLNEDGSVPSDNPFVNQKDKVAAIWSYGHRNPQGLYYDEKNGILWEQEHGPRGGDEINIIEKGKNYGWPVITYGREYHGPKIGTTHKEGMEQPVYQFTPSIAPSGLSMHQGYLYSGALALTHLNRLLIDGKKIVREERMLEHLNERFRNVKVGPDDLLYASTDSGKIFQIKL
ncbi:MAG: PQQ-dependent sugar dehydrogenase, partial [Bdellovibrionota bacterium]